MSRAGVLPPRSRKRPESIPEPTTARLSIYLRCLEALAREKVESVSSAVLASRFELKSDQIRKDLACFGEFGVPGVGYRVPELRRALLEILGLTRRLGVIVVGAGRLGTALADYPGFNGEDVQIVGLFDADPAKAGQRTQGGVEVLPMERLAEIVLRRRAEIAILAVPPRAAQEVASRVVAAGVKAILNFAPVALRVPRGVKVKPVDLRTEIEGLAFFLTQPQGRQRAGRPARAGAGGQAAAAAEARAAAGAAR